MGRNVCHSIKPTQHSDGNTRLHSGCKIYISSLPVAASPHPASLGLVVQSTEGLFLTFCQRGAKSFIKKKNQPPSFFAAFCVLVGGVLSAEWVSSSPVNHTRAEPIIVWPFHLKGIPLSNQNWLGYVSCSPVPQADTDRSTTVDTFRQVLIL